MALANTIQLGRSAEIFCNIEAAATPGTIAYPATGDLIIPSGAADFNQVPSYTNSEEVRDSRSLKDRFIDQNPAGSWSIPMYCRPSGSLGSIPDGAQLLQAAFGKQTISAGSSVTYACTMDNDLPTMTIAFKFKDMVFAILGATVNTFKAVLTNKGAINFTFDGGFMSMIWAGKAEIASATGTSVVLDDLASAQKFRPGMKIKFQDLTDDSWKTNSDAGYAITAVNEETFTLTITPTISEFSPAANDIVQGWLPTGSEVGDPITAKTGTVEMDAVSVPLNSMDVTLNNNNKYLEDEISTEDYPTAYISDERSIVASTSLYLRTNDLKYFRQGQSQTEVALVMKGGDTAGAKIELSMPQAVGDIPSVSGDLEKMLAINFVGLASAALEDEVSLKFI